MQCLHVGPYDDEPETLAQMDAFAAEQGCVLDFSETRRHHEIYLGDPRRTAPEKLKTVLRHPIRKIKTGKFTNDVAFICQMCYTKFIYRKHIE